jgi:hypothetical protein
MAPESECEREMFVEVAWDDDSLAVPLIQLAARRWTQALTKRSQTDIVG